MLNSKKPLWIEPFSARLRILLWQTGKDIFKGQKGHYKEQVDINFFEQFWRKGRDRWSFHELACIPDEPYRRRDEQKIYDR